MNHHKKIIFAALTLLIILFSLFSFVVFSKAPTASSARAAVLYEPTNKEFLYSKSENTRLPMASTTKIMTALVAIRECPDLFTEIKIDPRAVGIEGSSAYFKGGEVYTLYDLLHILMLRSANDAACQIAYTVSGDIDAFAALMNETAYALGLTDTNFTNPSGLDDNAHYTTAHDLAIISAEALKYDVFSEIVSKRTYTATELTTGKKSVYVNHNKLLSMYDGANGIKTGYTKRSGRSLVSSATRDGVTLIAVTIDAPNDWQDQKEMLDFGFSSLEYVNAVSAKELSFTLPVVNSPTEYITLKPMHDFGFVSKKGEKHELIYDIPSYLIAPVELGERVGEIRVLSGGKTVGSVNLIAESFAEKNKTLFEKITGK